ncbi:unnamed protein product [Acanthoscelides obtectus]|uniref:Uncharacterized protein n=1 Tax=Acanthoscelides obtectus TaxID=200917 RepID=A0A9P0P3Q8_ACAOB|nr:unnamed protein product [Acanthoscelides obtectus]CAK1633488.1 hypothetical protein AOBTE_LOCUS8167 [Acanthoscelides obtectus]
MINTKFQIGAQVKKEQGWFPGSKDYLQMGFDTSHNKVQKRYFIWLRRFSCFTWRHFQLISGYQFHHGV